VTTEAGSGPAAGDVLELTVGEVVHGGWCVSRQDDTGWVILVRHALPGERVLATITQATARFARADATRILTASADRVPPPCPYARPGGCGGCDWQHARLPAQRELKAEVIRQQLARIGRIDRPVRVEPVGGDQGGLGWRTVVSFAVGRDGAAGLRKHRSHDIVAIDRCLIAHELVTGADATGLAWPGAEAVEVSVAPETGQRGVLVTGPRNAGQLPEVEADSVQLARAPDRRRSHARRPVTGLSGARTLPTGTSGARRLGVARRTEPAARTEPARVPVRGSGYLTHRAAGRSWRVTLGGFWQVHPGAADVLAAAVLAEASPQPGDVALDLYCGAGLFAGVLAAAVGPDGGVIAIEQDPAAVRDARHNLRDFPWVRVHRADAGTVLSQSGAGDASVAVLDPPRTGASRAVIEALSAPGALRRVAYVSCDPATLARDLRLLLDAGWELTGLRGYDAFPMTHHVECLATLSR